MPELRRRLRDGPCLLLDGGMGTMLLGRGLARGDAPERLNLERPDTVAAVHRAYVEAGSDAVHTNTFGGNPTRLGHFGLADRCEEVNRRAAEIARGAGPAFVLGDVGPTGEYLPPVGGGDQKRWRDGFRRQARALLEGGVDGFHVETMSDLREAEAALEAIRELESGLPVLVSLTFDRKRRGFFTVMGDPLAASLARLARAGADAVGANCTLASADMRDLAAEALREVDARLVFQANAGQPRPEGDGLRYDQDPAEFAADLRAAIRGGAAAVGGCCGTDPRFITELLRVARPAGAGEEP
jgi:5-methyltetrahydrofolate--homocysteine methyltransferase